MNKFLLVIIVFSVSIFAQSNDERLTESIENLFAVSKQRDYTKVCDLIAYTGSDETRYLSAKLNAKNNYELQQAERIAKKIKAYVDISDSYEITSTDMVKEEDKEFLHAKIEFKSGKQILEVVFKFVEINEVLLLVEID
ncbi:MAG TPA: hypothetical protein ENN33_15190 [Ignavibacteria bacterium]|nr:hypothetical protein [Ignavibacteria bacterium]